MLSISVAAASLLSLKKLPFPRVGLLCLCSPEQSAATAGGAVAQLRTAWRAGGGEGGLRGRAALVPKRDSMAAGGSRRR